MSESYKKFYTEYKSKLYSYLLYKSEDAEIAQDIMQESFARHFKHYGQQPAASPALLFTIARNALVDHQRTEVSQRGPKRPNSQTAEDQESLYISKEVSSQVYKAINRLSEQDREILALAVGGVPYKEIATMFDMSISNIKIRIHRTRKRLQRMLAKEV